ncbi:MAG: peptidoglycan DD-metalloendopeptidase family protein, partial [Parasphingorhabdus sp.]
IQAAEADITAARTRIAIVTRLQQRQRARLAEKQGPMIRLTAALQMMTRKPTALALVEPRSLDELIYMRSILSAVMPEIQRRTASLRDEVRQGERLRLQAARAIASLDESQRRLADRRRQLAGLEASERIEAARFSDDAGIEQDRALALGEEARDIVDLMDQIRESSEVREALAQLDGPMLRPGQGRDTPASTPPRNRDVANAYRLPVNGEIVIGLGEISDSGHRSRGLTIAVASGAQIVAPAAGRVAYAGRYRGYGNIIIIEHDAGWTSLITNMATIRVAVGDQIVQGAPVGRSGSDEPTVTVELRRNGRAIDIAALIG